MFLLQFVGIVRGSGKVRSVDQCIVVVNVKKRNACHLLSTKNHTMPFADFYCGSLLSTNMKTESRVDFVVLTRGSAL